MNISQKMSLALACALATTACSSSTPSGGTGPTDAGQDVAAPPNDASGGETGPVDGAADAPAAQGNTQLTLSVPADFTGATRQLDIVLSDSIPIMGPPSGILLQTDNPQVTAGQPLVVHADGSGTHGNYYVVVVLYMQGGGKFSPKSGVDYVATSKTKINFTGAAMDLGTMDLAKAP